MAEGLRRYHLIYVVQAAGVPFGSSLFGALRLLFGYLPILEVAGLAAMLLLLAAATFLWVAQRIGKAEILFLVTAAYCLGAQVFADYHLLVFAAPLMLAGLLGNELRSNGGSVGRAWVLSCCFLLAPKSYVFFSGSFSLQILLNPLILLAGVAAIMAVQLRNLDPAGGFLSDPPATNER
jgi:hypothetical protein